jgi:hypothetical protein|nr:MAG TPA: hypothetical protein [Caudoviricetes sp.]
MIEIIETNLAIDENKDIRDHQSRVVLADDWESYCEAYEKYDGSRVTFPSKSPGASIYEDSKIEDLEYDEYHLHCRINKVYFTDTRLAYKIS